MKDFFEERDKIRDKIIKAESKAEGNANSARNLMSKLGYSEAEALDFLDLTGEERENCLKVMHEQKIA